MVRRAAVTIALLIAISAPAMTSAASSTNPIQQPALQTQVLEGLASLLRAFKDFLANQAASPVPQQVAAGGSSNFAGASRIDNLSNVSVTNVSGLTDSDIPDNITASNYLPLTGGTINGNLSVTGSFSGGSIAFSGASTTNATSTTLYASVAHLLSAVVDTLTSAAATITNLIVTTIVGTNATFTNATTTNATSTNFFSSNLAATNAALTNATSTSLFASNLTLGSALSIGNGGTGVSIPSVSGFPVEAYGAVGDGSTNDTTAIQNAINAACTALGGKVVFGAKIYSISSTLTIPCSNIYLVGQGMGGPGIPGNPSAYTDSNRLGATVIKWSGSTGGTMVDFEAPDGSAFGVKGGGIDNLVLAGYGVAGTGLKIRSMRSGIFPRLTVENVTSIGVDMNVTNNTYTSGEPYDLQQTDFGQLIVTLNWNMPAVRNATCVLLDGSPTHNTSFDVFNDVYLVYENGYGMNFANSDSNTVYTLRSFQPGGYTGPLVGFQGSTTIDTVARNNTLFYVQNNPSGVISYNNSIAAPYHNQILSFDNGNGGAAVPTVQSGSSLSYFTTQGAMGTTTVNGGLGINTSNVNNALAVQSSANLSTDGIFLQSPNLQNFYIRPSSGAGSSNPIVQSGDHSLIFSNNSVDTGNFVIAPWASAASGIRIVGSTGFVGIGTSTPAATLSIAGNEYATGGLGVGLLNTSAGTIQTTGNIFGGGTLALSGTTGTTTIASGQGFTIGGSQFLLQQGSGNVGIGLNNPGARLHLMSSANLSGDGLEIQSPNLQNISIRPSTGAGGSNPLVQAGDLSMIFTNNSINTGNFVIAPWASTAVGMRMTSTGQIGVDVALPSYSLDVAGFINTDQYSGYKQAGNTILYSSSTNSSTLVGISAGANLLASTTLAGNTALGFQALLNATSSSYNTAVGYKALTGSAAVSNGGFNTALGYQTLTVNTSGVRNTATGYNALTANTNGNDNTAFGYLALSAVSGAINNNTAFGSSALKLVTGAANLGVGSGAGGNMTSGGSNTYVGALNTGLDNNTGSFSTIVGSVAGWGNSQPVYAQTGETFVGYGVMSNGGASVTSANVNNTALGYEAFFNGTSGYNNLCLGGLSCQNLTSGSNNVAIGWNALLPSATANNQLNIDNIIFGTGVTATSTDGSNIPTLTGSIGVGTSTPYSRLTVWGPDSAASTTAFLVANSASTTEFAVLDNGNATLAGNLIQNSDQRLKTDIQSLSASSSIAAIKALNPVSYSWIDPEKGSVPQYGFIAQDVQKIFPNLVALTSPTALTPDGTLSLNYNGFIAPLVATVQDLINRISDFADHFTTKELTFTRATGDEIDVQRLCIGSTCVTEDQLKALLNQAGQPTQPATAETSPADAPSIVPDVSTSSDTTMQEATTTTP